MDQLQRFASEQQRLALQSNDEATLKAADERALADAILASLADLKNESSSTAPPPTPAPVTPASSSLEKNRNPSSNSSKATTPSQEYYEGSRQINKQLRGWLQDHGFSVVPNSGKNANCLLISMIQHAKGNYDSEHDAEVNDLRERAKRYTRIHHPENPSMNDYSLNSDDDLTVELVQEINRGITDSKEKLSFFFVTADIHGEPFWRRVGDGQKIAIIFDQGGHYEAVVPRSISTIR